MNTEKIQKLIEKMIREDKKIKSVTKAEDDFESGMEEYYFSYPEDIYLWSIVQSSNGEISIFYYPSRDQKSVFIRVSASELDIFYQDKLKTLFDVVRGKLFGFDDVLDNILEDKFDF